MLYRHRKGGPAAIAKIVWPLCWGYVEDVIILYRVYFPKTTEIVTTSDVKFHGVVSVPPEMVRPSFRGRTDKPSATRHCEALDVRGKMRKDAVRDGNDDMPVWMSKIFYITIRCLRRIDL